jgi:hypothetical protein
MDRQEPRVNRKRDALVNPSLICFVNALIFDLSILSAPSSFIKRRRRSPISMRA